MTTATAFDTETLRRAIEQRDSATLMGLYADDAELIVADRRDMPSHPRVIRGKQAIAAYFDDVCGRDMTHEVERVVAAGDTAAYLENCTYPDGVRVTCAAVLDIGDDGRIHRQSGVQAWDE
jgi:ketosteroid isomerase-like protein